MRRALFINPPLHENELSGLSPPLGLLSLAEVALDLGWDAEVVDLALDDQTADAPEEFYESAVARISAREPDLLCLTSMGVNTHVALEIGRRVHARHGSIPVFVGGVHFSELANYIVDECDFIDTVVCGEGELTFANLLGVVARGDTLPRICAKPAAQWQLKHPFRAYSLIDVKRYFDANDRRVANYEGGRGCRFSCSYCYSPTHYGSWRYMLADQAVRDWERLGEIGFTHVFDVQDNFTNRPGAAVAFCERLAASDLPVTWNCYATIAQVNDEVATAMGRAKCDGVYIGVDAVTKGDQDRYNKQLFKDVASTKRTVSVLRDAGVRPTVALMIDLHEFDLQSIEQILWVAAACVESGAAIRLNSLSVYPGTELAGVERPVLTRYSTAKIDVLMDCPPVVRENPYARRFPELFPFHAAMVADEATWRTRVTFIWLAQRLLQLYARDFVVYRPDGRNVPIVNGLMALADNPSSWPETDGVAGLATQFPSKEVY